MGGMVSYSNELKTKHLGIPEDYIRRHGAVSPQVAKKMAQGVRKPFNTIFGLSTTGVAGATGGTKRSPIRRVFIGISDGRRTWVIKENLKGNRRMIKRKAAEKNLEFSYGALVHDRRS